MIIKISKNYCSIEFEFTGDHPDAEYLQELYNLLPDGPPPSPAKKEPPPPPAKKNNQASRARQATPKQKALLEKLGYFYPGMSFEEASETLTSLGY